MAISRHIRSHNYDTDDALTKTDRMDSYRKKGIVICCGGHTEIY